MSSPVLALALLLEVALNPLVVRRESVPAATDCAPGVALPERREDVLRDLRAAVENNDRPAFDAALARARSLGDRDALRVWEDIGRVWDAQFQSPFFAAGSPAHATLQRYPGFETAVRRDVLVDDAGVRFYPAAESREFLAAVASAGVRTARRRPSKIRTDDEEEDPSKPLPRVVARREKRPPRASSSVASARRPRRRVSALPPVPAPPATDTVAKEVIDPPPAVATTTPAATAAATTAAATATKTAPAPPAAVASDPGSTSPPPAIATDPGATPPPAIATQATPAEVPVPAAPAARRNLLLPLVVVLVGIGMLILLFRTKS